MEVSLGRRGSCGGAVGWPTAVPLGTDFHPAGPKGTARIGGLVRRTASASRLLVLCSVESYCQRGIACREHIERTGYPAQQRQSDISLPEIHFGECFCSGDTIFPGCTVRTGFLLLPPVHTRRRLHCSAPVPGEASPERIENNYFLLQQSDGTIVRLFGMQLCQSAQRQPGSPPQHSVLTRGTRRYRPHYPLLIYTSHYINVHVHEIESMDVDIFQKGTGASKLYRSPSRGKVNSIFSA